MGTSKQYPLGNRFIHFLYEKKKKKKKNTHTEAVTRAFSMKDRGLSRNFSVSIFEKRGADDLF